MRIAVYSHYFAPEIGAPSARIHEMARHWVSLGNRVDVVTCYPNHPAGRLYAGYSPGFRMRETIDGIEVHRHWTYMTPNTGLARKALGHLSFLPAARWLSDPGLEIPDAVIGSSPTFYAAMAAAGRARRCRAPFIMEVRDLWPAIFTDLGVARNRRVIRSLESWEMSLYRKAARVVTVTESFRENIIKRGIASAKVETVLNGADTDFWHEVDVPPDLPRRLGVEGKFVVLYLGAHGISHALGSVLESAGLLSHRPELHFLFVGDGAEKEMLVRAAKKERLGNVSFLDPVEKTRARELYSLAGCCLVPLRNVRLFDAFIPSKLFEIMAMNRPIVASLRGEAAGILRRSGGSIVVEPEDSGAVARAVEHLRDHADETRTGARQASEFVRAHYSRRVLAARYLEILEQCVRERREELT